MQTEQEKELNTDLYLGHWWKSMQIHCLGEINNTERRISKLLSNRERCPASLHSSLIALCVDIVCLNKAVSLGPDPVITALIYREALPVKVIRKAWEGEL